MTTHPFQAGAAAMDITPQTQVALAGHLRRRDSQGVLDPLHARAIVLGDGQTKLAFVLLDLIAFLHEDCDDVRRGIADALQIPIANVCVSCTHTHTAPGVKDGFETPREADYLDWAKPRMVQAAKDAASSMVPAQVAWGIGHEARPQYNRRFHLRDGSVKMNPGKPDEMLHPAGPTDPALPLLLLRRKDDGQALGVLANYSLHYIGDHNSMMVSADYFGDFSRLAAERFGDSCVALLTHGASGDINNVNHQKLPTPWYPEQMQPKERSRIIAGWLLDQVQQVWDNADWHDEAPLGATQEIYEMRVRRMDAADIEEARRAADDESLTDVQRNYARAHLQVEEYPDALPQVISSLRVGNWAASTLTGEIFCQFGIDLRYASPFPVTALIELANGYGGYVPTEYSFALGGYETWLSRSAFAAPGEGEAMITAAARQLRELWLGSDPEKIEAAQRSSHRVNW